MLGFLGASAQSVTYNCNFQDTNYGYSCVVLGASIINENADVSFAGTHTNNRNNSDVVLTRFQSSTVNFVPNSIFSTFPNVEILDLEFCRVAAITQETFVGADNLRAIYFFFNDIQELPANVFSHAPNLYHVDLFLNRITDIHPEAFNGLENLAILDLTLNYLEKY